MNSPPVYCWVYPESAACPELRRFAEGIRRDEAAVRAAVTEEAQR